MSDASLVAAGDQTNARPTARSAPIATGDSSAPTSSAPLPGEQSNIGRIVAICTPLFVLAAGAVGKALPGVQLDQSQVVALMVAVADSALGAAWKWLQGWQQHEQNVADGKVQAWRKPH